MPDGSHVYMLLAAWSEHTGPLVLRNADDTPLRSRQCIDWLLTLAERMEAEHKPHTFVGFGLGYDFSMILHDMPERLADLLYSPQRAGFTDHRGDSRYVPWYGYRLRFMGSELLVSDAYIGIGAQFSKRTKQTRRHIGVWDTWRFFQGSFVKALRDWRILSPAKLDAMERMKRKRSAFRYADYCRSRTRERIERYCLNECEAGAALVTALADTCADLGYPLSRYDGAGSLAASMLKVWGISDYMAPVPEPMADAVSSAYFGGRFEIGTHGRINGPIYQDDINSAYPFHIARLPCLAHSTFRPSRSIRDEGLYRVRWAVPEPCRWGPLPHRNAKGSITFPRIGEGWYHGTEVTAAQQLYPRAEWKVIEGWDLERGCADVPFEYVPKVYDKRRLLGASTAGIVLKLGLNSLYGKMAQSVGRPRYAQYYWAGMVTAGCRAQILDAIRLATPERVHAVATDSVLTDVILDLPRHKSKPLGEWEQSVNAHGSLIVQPGISISYDEHDTPTYKSRGIGRREFAAHADAALQAWQRMGFLGSFGASTHRFIGIKTAIARNRYEQRCRWVDVQPKLSYAAGTKRSVPNDELTAHLYGRPTYSLAVEGDGTLSAPYARILARLGFDEATMIGEQPSLESELLQWVGVVLDATSAA